MSQTTSLTLIDKLRQEHPDSAAWSRLNDLYGPFIHAWCRKEGVRPGDVDDLSQDVYRVVLTKVMDFHRDKPGDTFRGWLRGITRIIILKHFGKIKNHPQAEGGTDANLQFQEVAAPEHEADDPPDEVKALYRRALALIHSEFSERDNRVFDLFVTEEKTADEVAAELGITPENVRKIKSRIVHRIREECGDA